MWIWEDGKQPRVNKRDGLAFVPFPRVYEKCRPTQLKDSVAYKPLSREKPRTSDAGDKRKRQTTGSRNQQTTRKYSGYPLELIKSKTFNCNICSSRTAVQLWTDMRHSQENKPKQRHLNNSIVVSSGDKSRTSWIHKKKRN